MSTDASVNQKRQASSPPKEPSSAEPPNSPERSNPPQYVRPPEKVRDDDIRPPLPGVVIDTAFFIFATVAAAWLAFRLLEGAWRFNWFHLLLLIPFWVMVAYLVLPRIHFLLTSIYVPNYFIARTRTSDGLLGDPVNLALDGTARQIHTAMTAAGWVLADPVTVRSSWGIIVSSVFRRSYPAAPVSPLALFGRKQCLAYQQEADGNAAQRHHVRFWRCPDGWLLPGGRRVEWLGAGTYDRAVGLSLFTLQVTHKIDADIDIERDYIVQTLEYACPQVSVSVIEDFSTGYHSRNGGGDAIRTDGDLPVINLTAVPDSPSASAELPAQVLQAARGYDDAQAEGGIASPDPDCPPLADASVAGVLPRPPAMVMAFVLVAVSIVINLATEVVATVTTPESELYKTAELDGALLSGGDKTLFLILLTGTIGLVYGAMAVVAVLTYRGYARPRVWLMALTAAAIITGELSRSATESSAGAELIDNAGLAVNVLMLLALTSQSSRVWSRRTSVERRRARKARKQSRKAAK